LTLDLPPGFPPAFTNLQPLNKLVEVPRVCNKWAEAYVGTDADDLIIYAGGVNIVLPMKVLEVALQDTSTFSLALEGYLNRNGLSLSREDFACLVTILMKLASKHVAERFERRISEILRSRGPSFSSILARLITIELQGALAGKVIADMGSGLLYVKASKGWVWGNEAEGLLQKLAQEVGERMVERIASAQNIDKVKALSTLTSSVVAEVVRQITIWSLKPSSEVSKLIAEGNKYIAYEGGYVDVDFWFRKGILVRHSDVDAIVIHKLPQESAEVPSGIYEDLEDIEAVAEEYTPLLLQAMRDWVPNELDRLNLWMAMGYAIYPKMPFRNFFLIVGPTSSGKSTFLDFLSKALGKQNISSVTLGQLLSQKSEYYAAELFNKLANLADEGINSSVLERKAKSLEMLKALVGGSYITARRPYSAPFMFVNYAKLFFVTNDERTADLLKQDPAVAKRMVVIKFKGSFRDNQAFRERLLREASKALPVLLVALRVLAKKGGFLRASSTPKELVSEVRELCKEACIEGRNNLFLSASQVGKRLGVRAKWLCKELRERGVECRYVVRSGRYMLALPREFLEA